MYNIAILASGSGTNAENIAKTFNQGMLLRVRLVLTDHADAGVIERMRPLGVETQYVKPAVWRNEPQQVVDILNAHGIDLVALAGFMRFVSPVIVDAFPQRIINIHPALLPAYGGKGMWGHHVHEAVIAAGEKQSGVTVHYVDDKYDHGEILMQDTVEITPDDTPETLEQKIHRVEYSLYPRAIVEALRRLSENEDSKEEATAKAKPTVDEMWAETLKVDYDASKAVTPPPIPQPAGNQPTPPNAVPPTTQTQTPPPVAGTVEPMPQSYLTAAIIVTLLCCFIPGVLAIVFSSRVSSKYYAGDIEGARRASRLAQIWIIVSFCLGVLSTTLYLPYMIVASAFGA